MLQKNNDERRANDVKIIATAKREYNFRVSERQFSITDKLHRKERSAVSISLGYILHLTEEG